MRPENFFFENKIIYVFYPAQIMLILVFNETLGGTKTHIIILMKKNTFEFFFAVHQTYAKQNKYCRVIYILTAVHH